MAGVRLFEVCETYWLSVGGRAKLAVVSPRGIVVQGLPAGAPVSLVEAGVEVGRGVVGEVQMSDSGAIGLILEQVTGELRGEARAEVWTTHEGASVQECNPLAEAARRLGIDLRGIAGMYVARNGWLLAEVLPSFDPPAALGLTWEKRPALGVFVAVPESTAERWNPPEAVSIPDEVERIARGLERIEVAAPGPLREFSTSLDGIVYRVSVVFAVASGIAKAHGGAAELEYLEVWRGYLDRG